MEEYISTHIQEGKSGMRTWLQGGKLSRANWERGDTVEISTRDNGSVIVLSRANERVARSTLNKHNISGKKKRGSEVYTPIIDFPIQKAGVEWKAKSELIVHISENEITISTNDYVQQRKDRLERFLKATEAQQVTCLEVDVGSLDKTPLANHTEQVDVCKMTFDHFGDADSRFFNAILSLETANPYVIEIENYLSQQNTPQKGLISILNHLQYDVVEHDGTLTAISTDLMPYFDKERLTESFIDSLTSYEVDKTSPKFGQALSTPEERKKFLADCMARKELPTTSLFHGGGTVEASGKFIFEENGIKQTLKLVSEIHEGYLSHSYAVNRHCFDENTMILNGDMTSFDASQFHAKSALLVAGIVCKGASKAGITKLKLSSAEDHKVSGHLFWPTLKQVAYSGASIVAMENTNTYKNTASFKAICAVMDGLGYSYDFGIINSELLGCMEKRKRLYLIACDDQDRLNTENIFSDMNDDALVGPRLTVSHLLDEDSNEKEYTSPDSKLAKQKRDLNEGKGFKLALYYGSETSVNVIRQQYSKKGSTDPYYVSPKDGRSIRIFSPLEHCKIKEIDTSFITEAPDQSGTLLHSVLGQGWTF